MDYMAILTYISFQHISLNGFVSEMKKVTCVVPQRSSLGPLLFLIYINDFRLCLNKTNSGHFADDTFIMYNSKKLKTIKLLLTLNYMAEIKQIISKFWQNWTYIFSFPTAYIKLWWYLNKYLTWNAHIPYLCKKLQS